MANADLALERGDYEQAEALFERAKECDPDRLPGPSPAVPSS